MVFQSKRVKYIFNIKQNVIRVIFCIFLILVLSCASIKTGRKSAETINDPWHGRYRHFSGGFDLILNHFSEESVAVDIFEVPSSNTQQRPRASFFAQIRKDKAIFQPRSEPGCRVEFQKVEAGIMMADFCNGTGEEVGLYRLIDRKVTK